MLNKNDTYALVGASNNKDKYGYLLLNYLKNNNFKVIPVNLKESEILNLKVYKNLSEIKSKVDTVIFVVPPPITEKILKEVFELKIKNVWLQPGSESDAAITYCQSNNINCVDNACIMKTNK
jgi:predicted CoA-binding protein